MSHLINFPAHVLGDMSVEKFLRDYWQKKPLLIRNAWPNFDPHLTPEELAGLALEETVDSRIVIEQSLPEGASTWQLRQSPFSEEDFTTLPKSNWSLLVNDIEKHLPEFQGFLKPFEFIPNWRRDDLMISYAAPGGSVGPHVDAYDVFLLQAYGQRHWAIQCDNVAADKLLPDSDLRILQDFSADSDWILNPGDMLYLPPHIAHHGVAVDRCMTYSIGFRAPTDVQLLDHFVDYLYDTQTPESRFTDTNRTLLKNPSLITSTDIDALKDMMVKLITDPSHAGLMDKWLGKTLSAAKKTVTLPVEPLTELTIGDTVCLLPGVTVTTVASYPNMWFIDGQEIQIVNSQNQESRSAIAALVDNKTVEIANQTLINTLQPFIEAEVIVYTSGLI